MKYFAFIISVLFGISCGSKTAEVNAEAPRDLTSITLTDIQIKNAGIAIGKMQERQVTSILKVNGKVDVPPQNMVSISVPLGGYLKTTKLLPGMHVQKGEVIAVMEDQQYIQLQQDYLTARAKISYLENEYLRQKDLNQSKAASDKVFQQAEADYNSQRVLITSLSEKLKLTGINVDRLNESTISRSINIYSPINGYVSAVNVNIGKYVSPTEVLFELINPSDIHLALKIFEKDLDKIFIGQKLIAYTNNRPDKKYHCEVLLIGKDLTPDRNTDVHCHFEEYDKTLVPGTYMNAEVEVKNNKAVVLPEESMVRFENKYYVFIRKSGNTFEMKEIEPGTTDNGFVEIHSAENLSGNEFVTKGAYSVLMSLKNTSEE
jgi:cobalt-zinc-cadmium efflux system membrane fusion protein